MVTIFPQEARFKDALSVSQVYTFLKCRKAWGYSYQQLLSPKYDKPYFAKGKLAHAAMKGAWMCKHAHPNCSIDDMTAAGVICLELEYAKYVKEVDLTAEEGLEIDVLRKESISIFTKALIAFKPEEWKVLTIQGFPAVELHFALPIRGFKKFHGFIDLVARNAVTNQIWQIDFKFRSNFEDQSYEMFNIQNAAYTKAMQQAKVNTVGSITFQVLNIAPSVPSMNKNGTISKAKIRISWGDYAAFCIANGQNPDDYEEEMKPKLAEIEWYRLTQEYRNEYTLKTIWKDIIQAAAYEIKSKKLRELKSMYSMNCRLCSFMDLCQAELRGYDIEDLLLTKYVRKEDLNGKSTGELLDNT